MTNSDTKRIKILVADDEKMILELYDHVIGQHHTAPALKSEMDTLGSELFNSESPAEEKAEPVYDLTLCKQGDEAVEAVSKAKSENDPFAIAFLDMRMPPGPDGIWTAENIRAICPDIQIVIVTGYSDLEPAKIEKRVPPPDRLLYIQKPFHPLEMRQIASTMAARWKAERNMLLLNRELEVKVKERTAELQKAYEQLEYRAIYDSLTGLLNRAEVLKALDRELNRMQRTKKPLSIIMADLDNFKNVNDTFGHQAGDAVLVEASRRMRKCVRAYDTVGRMGGEEFLIVLPGCDTSDCMSIADRICSFIGDTEVEIDEVKISITISLGVFTTTHHQADDKDMIISAVDKALYQAKNEGRNTIRVAQLRN